MGDDPGDDPYAKRDGEAAVELPANFAPGLFFTARTRTPGRTRAECPKNARESDAVCTIEVEPHFAAALKGVETCSHMLVLYWMDRARRDLVVQAPRHYGEPRRTFPLRSAARHNPSPA